MQRTHSGRSALIRLATAGTLTLLLGAALTAVQTTASAVGAPSTAITVRVEGPKRTLVPATSVVLSNGTIVKDGVATDSCSGTSAAGALELATRGDWSGTWSASFNAYFLTTIDGLAFPSTGAEYWAFWVNDAPSSEGICSYDPKPGDSLLFFPDCFGKTCPKNGGVLGVKAPAVAIRRASVQRVGHRLQRRQGNAEQGGRSDRQRRRGAGARRPRTARPSCRSPRPAASR